MKTYNIYLIFALLIPIAAAIEDKFTSLTQMSFIGMIIIYFLAKIVYILEQKK